MPRIDNDSKQAGLIGILPMTVTSVAKYRKAGYVKEVMQRSKNINGMLYIHPDDYATISENYSLSDKALKLAKKKVATAVKRTKGIANPKAPTENDRLVAQFINLNAECPREDLKALRDAYAIEVAAKKATGCTGCALTPIRKKYTNIIKKNFCNE